MNNIKNFFKTFRVFRGFWLIAFTALQIFINTLANGWYPLWSFIGLVTFGVWTQSEENELTPFSISFFRILLVFSVFLTSFSFVRFLRTGKNALDIAFYIILLVIHILEMVAV